MPLSGCSGCLPIALRLKVLLYFCLNICTHYLLLSFYLYSAQDIIFGQLRQVIASMKVLPL